MDLTCLQCSSLCIICACKLLRPDVLSTIRYLHLEFVYTTHTRPAERNYHSPRLHAKVCAYERVSLSVSPPSKRGTLSDGGEGEEEQEASRAVRSRHGGNIWQRFT